MAEKTCSLLEDNLQAKWTFLTSSSSQKLSYHQSLQYPIDMQLHVERLDMILWSMLESAPHPARGGGAWGRVCAPGACMGDGGPVLPAVAGPPAHQGEKHGVEESGGHLPRRLHQVRGDVPHLPHRGGGALPSTGVPHR